MFITIEGGEGSGKTTLIQGLKQALEEKGYTVLATREPGGTALGDRIRELLLSPSDTLKIGTLAELFLFLASRSQHLEEIIKPALKRGEIVICDRFNDSTVAYQGVARDLGTTRVRKLAIEACGGQLPDFTILLDIDPAIGLKRSQITHKKESLAGSLDRIESETLQFHVIVRNALLEEVKRRPNTAVLDAMDSKEELIHKALIQIERLLP